jgi:vacuolar-type H+-ATPase subunit H
MSNAIESTLKALTDFEAQLNAARDGAADAKRQMTKSAAEWAESARAEAVAEAQKAAAETVAKARREAEKEAKAISEKGKASLKHLEATLASNRSEAASLVRERLLGASG